MLNGDVERLAVICFGLENFDTVKEAAALLKTSRVQVRKMIHAGDLLAVKVGREYRIPEASLRGFVEECLA